MKTTLRIILLTLILASPAFAGVKQDGSEGIEEVASKDRDLFVFRAKKQFVGAKVEIFLANGDLVTAQRLDRKKMIIDFGDVSTGVYTIKVSKGNLSKEFQYEKK